MAGWMEAQQNNYISALKLYFRSKCFYTLMYQFTKVTLVSEINKVSAACTHPFFKIASFASCLKCYASQVWTLALLIKFEQSQYAWFEEELFRCYWKITMGREGNELFRFKGHTQGDSLSN